MRNFPLSRRGFLAGVGTTAMGTLLRPIMAYAQLGTLPQRLLFIHRSDGTTLGTANDAAGGRRGHDRMDGVAAPFLVHGREDLRFKTTWWSSGALAARGT
jgi:hypothetical protein